MKLLINGQEREVSDGATLPKIIEYIGFRRDLVAIQLNLDVIPKDRWDQTTLTEGDRVEIVHMVGGG